MATTINPNQINTSILGMASAVFTSVCEALVTTAVQSNVLIRKTFSVLIHGVSAAEHISMAAEGRAEIYGNGIVANGILSERETQLKHKLRLYALEAQEESARTKPKADTLDPATTDAKPDASKDTLTLKDSAKPQNAA